MVTAEVQVEAKESGITTKQRELLRKVVKGFDLEDIIEILIEEYGPREFWLRMKQKHQGYTT